MEVTFQQGMTFVSHCPRRGKLVLALSTQHQTPNIDEVSGKPEIILTYVQRVKEMMQGCTYGVRHRFRRLW